MSTEPRSQQSTWVEVNLSAIQNNVRKMRARTGTPVMVVVKANGYGHGAVPVARAALKAGASWCAIARADEAVELREAGLDCPLLMLGHHPRERIGEMIDLDVSLTLWNEVQARAVSTAAEERGKTARVQLKVDTGMSRLGVQPDQAARLIRLIRSLPYLHLEGIFTHFATADEADTGPADEQERKFKHLLSRLKKDDLLPDLIHAANSAASLSRPGAHFDLLRVGISIYGLNPSPECVLPDDFQPALTWKSVLSQVKTLPPGRGISYGHMYTTRGEERIGTVPVGYADGYHRVSGSEVLVGGKRVPVIGRVCMDQIMVNLDQVTEAEEGDEVVLIGRQGASSYTADDLAQVWDSVNYEVVCAIADRVPRYYHALDEQPSGE